MGAWLSAVVRLTIDLAYTSLLLWLALMLLDATGVLPTHVILVDQINQDTAHD
jgi:hypothetical protein